MFPHRAATVRPAFEELHLDSSQVAGLGAALVGNGRVRHLVVDVQLYTTTQGTTTTGQAAALFVFARATEPPTHLALRILHSEVDFEVARAVFRAYVAVDTAALHLQHLATSKAGCCWLRGVVRAATCSSSRCQVAE